MRAFVANTDYDWYAFLAGQPDLDEVNFWKPSGKTGFQFLSTGEPFFFKLKQRHRHAVVGFGLYVLYRRLTVGEAWAAFETRNGAPSLSAMWERVTRYTAHGPHQPLIRTHPIGCILLTCPVFFPPELWIEGPADWHPNIVSGKGYDTTTGEGRRLWNACIERTDLLPLDAGVREQLTVVADASERYGAGRLVHPRLGQGTFRYAVEAAYKKCAVTREHSLPALEAAHILPYAEGGPHEIPNGLLLRADIHHLFDRGYVTVTPDYHFRVSERLYADFHNGHTYYRLDRTPLWLPRNAEHHPNRDYLAHHQSTVFLGT